MKSFSLGQVSLLWKFELNWISGCWEKFVWWWWWHSRIKSLQVLLSFEFWLWTLDFGLGLWQKVWQFSSFGYLQNIESWMLEFCKIEHLFSWPFLSFHIHKFDSLELYIWNDQFLQSVYILLMFPQTVKLWLSTSNCYILTCWDSEAQR